MAEREEFTPDWSQEKQVQPGTYIWTVYIKNCSFKESVYDGVAKPYMQLSAIVEDPPGAQDPMAGTDFDFKLYLNPKAAWKCIWFLKKFEYPAELMTNEKAPVLRKNEVAGLHGKVLVKVEQGDSGYLNFYVNGFDHIGGDELEKKQAKKNGTAGEQEHAVVESVGPTERVIDLQEDVHGAVNMDSEPDPLDDL